MMPLRPILVVDDDPAMARTLSDILKLKGYDTDTASSGREALERVETTPYACVLSDVKMPGMNGVELSRSIRTLRPGTPIMLMTAYSKDSLLRQGHEEGVIAILNKPLNLDQVLSLVAEVCR